jgi:hypothetical protein
MASKKSAAAGGVQIPDMPKGFMDLSKRECDGFARPEAGLVIQGKIVGDYSYENDNGHQEVAQVELSEPCMAVVDKELVQLNKGQVIGVNVTPGLRELRDYFDARPNVYLVCLGKQDLKGGKSMWAWKVGVPAGTKKMPRGSIKSSTNDDGPIPF